jgi:hypothetical protein
MEGRNNYCVDTWTGPCNFGCVWFEINKERGGAKLVYGLVKIMKDGWNELIFMRVDRVF